MLGRRLLVRFQAVENALAVDIAEEMGLVGEIKDHPEGSDPDQDGEQPLQDEDPSPAPLAADTAHFADGGGEQTTEGARDGGGGEENGGADAELVSLVPAREVVIDAGEEAGLGQAEEPACGHHAGEAVGQAHGDHDDAPDGHDDGDEDAGPETFEHDVGQGLEDGVGDEEDGEGEIVLARGDVDAGLEAIEFGVPDVGSVEKGDEVEEAEPGDEAQVEFPEEPAVLFGCVLSASTAGMELGLGCPLVGGLCSLLTILARSSALRPASGSKISWWPTPSSGPALVPATFSSSEGEWPLSLSLWSEERAILWSPMPGRVTGGRWMAMDGRRAGVVVSCAWAEGRGRARRGKRRGEGSRRVGGSDY